MRKLSTSRPLFFVCFCWMAAAPIASVPGQPSSRDRELTLDVLYLESRVVRGLIVKETPDRIFLQLIYWKPGEPIYIPQPPSEYERNKVVRIDRLSPDDRERATRFIAQKQSDREKYKRMLESLELEPAAWGEAKHGGLSHRSKHFVLISNAREDIVRRAAVRLEQIFAAYEEFLPLRKPTGQPATILLVHSMAEYQEMLKQQGRKILNPAFYDMGRNEIICASDLERLGDELELTRQEHQRLRATLAERKRELMRQFKTVPESRQKELNDAELKIKKAEQENNKKFEAATARLFQTLYHEAFHAYLANFVYPPAEAAVPRWLNEGLAQIFETATLDGGELFVGRPDKNRVERMRNDLQQDKFLPVIDLLRAGPELFLVSHAGDQEVSDRYYLASWALAYYLTTERKILGSPELDRYVLSLKKPGADPLAAFADLVGQPLPAFEKTYGHYLRKLQANGSSAKR